MTNATFTYILFVLWLCPGFNWIPAGFSLIAQTNHAATESLAATAQPGSPPVVLAQTEIFTAYRMVMPAPSNSQAVVVSISRNSFIPQVIGVTPSLPGGYSAEFAMKTPKWQLLIGSGFYETYYPLTPVGLLVIDRKTVNPLKPNGLSSIVMVKNNRLTFVSRESYTPRYVQGAFQAGPELARDGKKVDAANLAKSGSYTRSFIGIRRDGSYIIGITLSPVSLNDLASFICGRVEDGGLGCDQAVNLAGGGSEVLAFKTREGTVFFGNKASRQPAFVVFQQRISGPVE